MTHEAEAAMAAVETALAQSGDLTDEIASVAEMAQRDALDLIIAHFRGEPKDGIKVLDALDTLAAEFGHEVVDQDEAAARDWEDSPLVFDENHLDNAAGYARRGQFADALHHLERALPAGYGDIAERIARHLERTSP